MQEAVSTAVCIDKKAVSSAKKGKWIFALSLVFYPIGLFKIWRSKTQPWIKWLYSILVLPLFLLLFGYMAIVLFASFLAPIDRSVGIRTDRTIYNKEGNYGVTFLKTAAETNGAYELVQVELEPNGGNDWHYHNSFSEQFTVVEGQVDIGHNGNTITLNKGQMAMAGKHDMHFFKNPGTGKSVLQVKVIPAAGLEKTLRVAYGLINDGLLKNDMTSNPWHMALLLCYSESYLPVLPSWFQEPLINALAKIAQWRGEDRELYKYFR